MEGLIDAEFGKPRPKAYGYAVNIERLLKYCTRNKLNYSESRDLMEKFKVFPTMSIRSKLFSTKHDFEKFKSKALMGVCNAVHNLAGFRNEGCRAASCFAEYYAWFGFISEAELNRFMWSNNLAHITCEHCLMRLSQEGPKH